MTGDDTLTLHQHDKICKENTERVFEHIGKRVPIWVFALVVTPLVLLMLAVTGANWRLYNAVHKLEATVASQTVELQHLRDTLEAAKEDRRRQAETLGSLRDQLARLQGPQG